jgi:hypothetical protein
MDGIKCAGLMQQRYPKPKSSLRIYADYPHAGMIKAGPRGIFKNCGKQELEQCIRKVHGGGTFFSDDPPDIPFRDAGKTIKKDGQYLPSCP